MKSSVVFITLMVLLSACTISKPYMVSQHSFQHFPPVIPERGFYYTAYNLTGKATATYHFRNGVAQGGNGIKDGVVADAKQDLMEKHPLQPNEAYVNWSIDEMRTEIGRQVFLTNGAPLVLIQEIQIRITASADIIRFGEPPSYFTPQNAPKNASTWAPPAQQAPTVESAAGPTVSVANYEIGENVLIQFRGKEVEATVQGIERRYDGQMIYEVSFIYNGSSTSRKLFDADLKKNTE